MKTYIELLVEAQAIVTPDEVVTFMQVNCHLFFFGKKDTSSFELPDSSIGELNMVRIKESLYQLILSSWLKVEKVHAEATEFLDSLNNMMSNMVVAPGAFDSKHNEEELHKLSEFFGLKVAKSLPNEKYAEAIFYLLDNYKVSEYPKIKASCITKH